ncbi:MAG: dTDP-4-dehydrorhamnose 3,5-epimerase [Bacteroidota bacterium]
MDIQTTPIEGLLILNPRIFKDERGYFFESYNKLEFERLGLNFNFVQDNQSFSIKHVLRGLHYQNPPFEQGKLVSVASGAALDVAVDIRKDSKTFGHHFSVILSEENNKIFWIPAGFAHGFITLEDNTRFVYKCTNNYNKAAEGGIIWNDPDLNIDWGIDKPLISEKDQILPRLKEIKSSF